MTIFILAPVTLHFLAQLGAWYLLPTAPIREMNALCPGGTTMGRLPWESWISLLKADGELNGKTRELSDLTDAVLRLFWEEGCGPSIAAIIVSIEPETSPSPHCTPSAPPRSTPPRPS